MSGGRTGSKATLENGFFECMRQVLVMNLYVSGPWFLAWSCSRISAGAVDLAKSLLVISVTSKLGA